MVISEKVDQQLHHKLPIDADEKILAVYRHHWFAYAKSWGTGALLAVIIMVIAVGLTMTGGNDQAIVGHKAEIIGGAGIFSVLVILGSLVPVNLRSKEQLVLTNEALLQVLQPSLFASKVDQVGLQRIDDVSVRQNFFGTMFGFGHLTIETPGEQDNYEFRTLPKSHDVAREITEAHERYVTALEGGQLSSAAPNVSSSARPQIDPAEYQEFLKYKEMVARSESSPAADAVNSDTTAAKES